MSTNWADRIIFEDDYPKIDFSVMFLKFDEIDSRNVQYNNDSVESLYNKKCLFVFLFYKLNHNSLFSHFCQISLNLFEISHVVY